MFTVADILKATRGSLCAGAKKRRFTGVSTDSRTVRKGDLFLAIKGPRFDGHDFIEEVVKKGATGAVVSDASKCAAINMPVIKVKDTTEAFGDIAAYHRDRFDIPVIGITGSNGKTTVKELTAHVLSKRYRVLKNLGTENNLIGVPRTLLGLTKDYDVAVLEMGGNHIGEIGRLAEILRPTIGLITNIGQSHLEFLGDKEGVLRMKSELVREMAKKAVLVLNGDDDMLSRIRTPLKKITFGLREGNDFRATNIMSFGRISFVLNNAYPLSVEMIGKHNVYNVLAAVVLATQFEMNIADIRQALSDFRLPQMRMEKSQINGVTIINDAYNSNPLSLRCAIRALSELKAAGKKILVSGDMYELGKMSRYYHDRVGRMVARSGINSLITVGDMSRLTAKAAENSGMAKDNLWPCSQVKEAASVLKRIARKGDIVLIKGSRIMGMEKIIEAL